MEQLNCLQRCGSFGSFATSTPEPSEAIGARPARSLCNPEENGKQGATQLVPERRVAAGKATGDGITQLEGLAGDGESIEPMMKV